MTLNFDHPYTLTEEYLWHDLYTLIHVCIREIHVYWNKTRLWTSKLRINLGIKKFHDNKDYNTNNTENRLTF